jgi:4-hydroxybenzoate polyprenyltransferase
VKLIGAFFRLVRWPNLVFIAVAQFLFVYCIIMPVFAKAGKIPNLHGWNFVLLCISSVLVAAAGYIINDYFDLNIDRINKPQKLIVEKVIQRRWAIRWHWMLSLIGVGIGFYLDFTSGIAFLGATNLLCVLLLFVYSISLKRKLLLGNVLISLLTAWVILVVAWCEGNHLLHEKNVLNTSKIYRFTFLYAGFAFIISLIREVIKDMEDVEGDRSYGCKTMPIVWGLTASKIFVAVWLIVLIATLAIVQFYILQFGWWPPVIYFVATVIFPLLWIFRKLFEAQSPQAFHPLSSIIKVVMFTGILSMLFFKLYQ